MARLPARLVHPSTLLRMFKEVGYEEKILNGSAIQSKPLGSSPVPPGHHQPIGTMSETVSFSLKGTDSGLPSV